MAGRQHKVIAQNAELKCFGLARVKSVYSEIRQSWVFGLQMPSFFIKTVQSGLLFGKRSAHIFNKKNNLIFQ
jgi:hypothetical protein